MILHLFALVIYTEHEYRTWLTAAGFIGMERVSLTGSVSLITAHKPT
jgi:hypothetical protein